MAKDKFNISYIGQQFEGLKKKKKKMYLAFVVSKIITDEKNI